jgi:hypothetical protein
MVDANHEVDSSRPVNISPGRDHRSVCHRECWYEPGHEACQILMTVSQELEAGSLGHATQSLVNMIIAERLVHRGTLKVGIGMDERAKGAIGSYQSKGLGSEV